MKTKLLIFLIILAHTGLSQDLKNKRKSDSYYKEFYTIDKKSETKYGEYIRIDLYSKDTLVKGFYNNDERVRVWQFFKENNRVYLEYDYDKEKLNFVDEEITKIDSFPILNGTEYTMSKVDSPPIYLGYKNEPKRTIYQSVYDQSVIIHNEKAGISLVSFIVNNNGQIENIQIESTLDPAFDPYLIQAVQAVNLIWIPAKVNGRPIESKINILFDHKRFDNTGLKYKTPYEESLFLYVVDLVYYVDAIPIK